MRDRIQREAVNMFWVLLGVALFAGAYRLFLVPAGLYSGGFTGTSQLLKLLLEEVLHIPLPNGIDATGIIFWCINLPLLLLGYRSIGGKFLYRTIIAVTIQSLLLVVIPAPKTPLVDDLLLNCIIGGAISGAGVGITLRAGGSGGGLDILGMYFAKYRPDSGVGRLSVMINACIYLITALRFDLEVAAYSMVFAFVAGIMVDRVHYQNIKVSALIVTRDKTLGGKINSRFLRGVTSWRGWGEYSRSDEIIHMVVVSKYELQALKKLISREDPHAFVQIISPDAVLGHFEKRLEVQ